MTLTKGIRPCRTLSTALGFVAALAITQFARAAPAQRIVSTSPGITETLFAMGLGPRVVGDSLFCNYPAEARKLPRIGTYLQPDPELIIRLNPDLVIVQKLPNGLADRLSALHLRHIAVESGSLENVFTSIEQIGDATDSRSKASALISSIHAQLDEIRRRASGQPVRSALFLVGRQPGTLSDLIAVGRHSYIDQLIQIAGGRNVLDQESLPAYPKISLETVLRFNPDVIIDMANMGASEAEKANEGRADRHLWMQQTELSAVRSGRVFPVTSDVFVVPGPRVTEAVGILYKLIHGQPAP